MNITDQVDSLLASLHKDADALMPLGYIKCAGDIKLAILLIEHYRAVEAMHLKFIADIKERVQG